MKKHLTSIIVLIALCTMYGLSHAAACDTSDYQVLPVTVPTFTYDDSKQEIVQNEGEFNSYVIISGFNGNGYITSQEHVVQADKPQLPFTLFHSDEIIDVICIDRGSGTTDKTKYIYACPIDGLIPKDDAFTVKFAVAKGLDPACTASHSFTEDDLASEGFGVALATFIVEDIDGDGLFSFDDNCPQVPNPHQENHDNDDNGDVCDPDFGEEDGDKDNDGIPNGIDNCPEHANPDQLDSDSNGIGDVCQDLPETCALMGDLDCDTILDDFDNCPLIKNTDQGDKDGNNIGDACDCDFKISKNWASDEECFCEANEIVFEFGSKRQCVENIDSDNDGILDSKDTCPNDATNTCHIPPKGDGEDDTVCETKSITTFTGGSAPGIGTNCSTSPDVPVGEEGGCTLLRTHRGKSPNALPLLVAILITLCLIKRREEL